ncbi:YtpR family tRNA-binding protein [Gracilibacillus sp. YIM 98692]|uniref:YtpR family tRNA-binding protein n=1 Tax=Gracilibacillus sp. YIM 98692 TaxID=2663532 RepID=UPI0013D41AC7|nr:DUF4479 family protein [Gracilibacillus sp. YIM 98692]
MYVYYNEIGLGDVLLFPVKNSEQNRVTFQTFGDVVKITDQNTDELLGYNVFQASKYFKQLGQGKTKLTANLLDRLKQIFDENDLNDSLEFDLTPKFVVGHVTELQQHENADKLKVCQVEVGTEKLQIVCGAPNVAEGQKVVVAKVGAIMPSGMEIKPTQLRGVDSFGMICSQKELGLPNAPKEKGIYVLDAQEKVGEVFKF